MAPKLLYSVCKTYTRMKKLIFISLLTAFAAAGVSAQNVNMSYNSGQQPTNANVEARAKEATDKLNSLLNLSSDQYNQVLQINRNFFYQPRSGGNGRGAARESYSREQQIKGVLTSDQWQQYQTARQNGQL